MSNQDIARTEINVPSASFSQSLPGAWDAKTLQENYANDVAGLGSMKATETFEEENGERIKVVTFAPMAGTKG